MIFLAFLYAGWAWAVEVAVEVGWAGRVVVSVVNPLWLTVSNPDPSPFSGEIQVAGRIGSPWRGEAGYTARIPLVLAPFGRTRFLIPWPVELGTTSVRVSVLHGEKEVFRQEVPLSLVVSRLHGAIGPPGGPAELLLSPADLPENPFLLWPFFRIDQSFGLSERGQAVIGAWASFLGGEGPRPPPCRVGLRPEPWRGKLHGTRPSPPLWAALLPGLALYLLALGPVLSAFSRGRPASLALVATVFLGFSLFYGVWRETVPRLSAYKIYKIEVRCASLTGFYLDLWGGVAWRAERVGLSGFWVEVLPERGWDGLDLAWVYGPEGWRTEAVFTPGRPRLFLRIAEDQASLMPSETTAPPSWLVSTLDLPWETARVERARLLAGSHQVSLFRVFLP